MPPKKRKREILKNGKFAKESAPKKPPPLRGEGWKLKISAQIQQTQAQKPAFKARFPSRRPSELQAKARAQKL